MATQVIEKVSFDGVTKVITVSTGINQLHVLSDVYSAWKRWVLADDINMSFPVAMTSTGGDTINSESTTPAYFFMENGWKIKPWEGHHELRLVGNLLVRRAVSDGVGTEADNSPIVPTAGNYKVSVERNTTIAPTVAVGSGVTVQDKHDIINMLLRKIIEDNGAANTLTALLNRLDKNTQQL